MTNLGPAVLATMLLISASLLITSVVGPLVLRNEIGTGTYLKVADVIRERPIDASALPAPCAVDASTIARTLHSPSDRQ
jgi:hypothetical protein